MPRPYKEQQIETISLSSLILWGGALVMLNANIARGCFAYLLREWYFFVSMCSFIVSNLIIFPADFTFLHFLVICILISSCDSLIDHPWKVACKHLRLLMSLLSLLLVHLMSNDILVFIVISLPPNGSCTGIYFHMKLLGTFFFFTTMAMHSLTSRWWKFTIFLPVMDCVHWLCI